MKNISASALILAAGLALTLGSCKKDDPTATPASTTPTPPSPTITRVGSTVMAGTLASIRMSYEYTVPQVNITVPIEIESAVAAFFSSSTNTFVDAGAVSVNSNALDKSSNNAYVKAGNFSATTTGQSGTSLGFENGSSWTVAGAGGITGFTYNHTASMPDYSSTLPTVTNNTALVEAVPFRYSVVTQGGKPYAFVKEYAAVGNVNTQ